jgi:hypothetical protein
MGPRFNTHLKIASRLAMWRSASIAPHTSNVLPLPRRVLHLTLPVTCLKIESGYLVSRPSFEPQLLNIKMTRFRLLDCSRGRLHYFVFIFQSRQAEHSTAHMNLLHFSRQYTNYTRWFKYNRDKLWLVYTQSVPVIFKPPCINPQVYMFIILMADLRLESKIL